MTSSLGEVDQTKVSLWPNSYKIDNTVSQEQFIQLLKIHYLVSYKVIFYNIKTCRGTKWHSKHALTQKSPHQNKKSNNNEHIYNLKRNLLNIQVNINMQLLYIRSKLNFNICSCAIWLVTAFTAALSKSMKVSVGSFPCMMTVFLTSLKSRLYASSFLLRIMHTHKGKPDCCLWHEWCKFNKIFLDIT